jgi:hypothetical protein
MKAEEVKGCEFISLIIQCLVNCGTVFVPKSFTRTALMGPSKNACNQGLDKILYSNILAFSPVFHIKSKAVA